jgi:hypothetical protein
MSRQLLGVMQPPPWRRRAAVIDPSRHFATVNCRIAKGLDWLVGSGEQHRRHFDTNLLRGLEVDRQFVFGQHLNRKVR